MAETKKLLVPFDPKLGKSRRGDFLVPRCEAGCWGFRGLKSAKASEFGMVAYVGVSITEKELFAKLVDSGVKIEDVEQTIENLRLYLEKVKAVPVGGVVRLKNADMSRGSFEFETYAPSPASASLRAQNE